MSLMPFPDWDDDNDDLIEAVANIVTPIASQLENLANILVYYAHEIYYWLTDVAPIVIKAQLRQLGRNGIDNLPFLSQETKKEIKRWLRNNFGL
jgi:hypothetical protein